jgi:hypothetical protein
MDINNFYKKTDLVILYNYNLDNHEYKYNIDNELFCINKNIYDEQNKVIILNFNNSTNVEKLLQFINIIFDLKLKLVLINCPSETLNILELNFIKKYTVKNKVFLLN